MGFSYFSSGGSVGAANTANSGNAAARESALRAQFDGLRGSFAPPSSAARSTSNDAPADPPCGAGDGDDKDTVGPDGTMQYFQAIGCNLEDASVFVAIETLRAENIGELKRDGFVNGWIEAR